MKQVINKLATINIMQSLDMNINFAKWLGLLLSDGNISTRYIQFSNKEEELLQQFHNLTKTLFNLNAKRIPISRTRRVISVQVNSVALVRYLNKKLYINDIKKGNRGLPKEIKKAGNRIKASFLQGLYDGDGYVYFNRVHWIRQIGLACQNNLLQQEIYSLLRDLGIKSRIDLYQGKILIMRKHDIKKFFDTISFSHPTRLKKLVLLVS